MESRRRPIAPFGVAAQRYLAAQRVTGETLCERARSQDILFKLIHLIAGLRAPSPRSRAHLFQTCSRQVFHFRMANRQELFSR